jgi:2-oxoglutarate ferredoxin oxidoreductase subunit beta
MDDPAPNPAPRAKDYKSAVKPIWCPGCGHFAVLAAVTRALAQLGLARSQVALVSGIGCSSRLPAYLDIFGFHGLHGRALPLGAGLKAARPDLTVLVAGGDGDGLSIGGNHFLHACRRNMDLTYIVMDNEVYGMTKGQASPTTAADWSQSSMTPEGTGIRPLQPAAIALAAGATWIARGFAGDPSGLTGLLVAAIRHRGFAFLHVLSPCLTFRPEQKHWKEQVHALADSDGQLADPAASAARLQADDSMALGLIHARELPVWQPRAVCNTTVSAIEQEFRV